MKKSLFWWIILLIVLSTYTPKFSYIPHFKLNIKEILIENNTILKSKEIKKKLTFLYEDNLFFFNTKNIEVALQNISFIESYSLKKIYPNKLKIKIIEKQPVAILQRKKEKYYISDKGEIIEFRNIYIYRELPTVFGEGKEFFSLFKNLEKIKFRYEDIKSFYYFESGRWDLILNDDKVIKLPTNNYLESLKNFIETKNNINFANFKIFDYRIKDQLILK